MGTGSLKFTNHKRPQFYEPGKAHEGRVILRRPVMTRKVMETHGRGSQAEIRYRATSDGKGARIHPLALAGFGAGPLMIFGSFADLFARLQKSKTKPLLPPALPEASPTQALVKASKESTSLENPSMKNLVKGLLKDLKAVEPDVWIRAACIPLLPVLIPLAFVAAGAVNVFLLLYTGVFPLILKGFEKLIPLKKSVEEEKIPLLGDKRWKYPDFPTILFDGVTHRKVFGDYFEAARQHKISAQLFFARALKTAGPEEVWWFSDPLFGEEEAKKLKFLRYGKIKGAIPMLTELLKSGKLKTDAEYLWLIRSLAELDAEAAIPELTRLAKGEGHLLGLGSRSQVRFEAAKAVGKILPDERALALVSAFREPISEISEGQIEPLSPDGMRGPRRAVMAAILKRRFLVSYSEIDLAEAEILLELGRGREEILSKLRYLMKAIPPDIRVLKILNRLKASEELLEIYGRLKKDAVYPLFSDLVKILIGLGKKSEVQDILDDLLNQTKPAPPPWISDISIEDCVLLAQAGYRNEAVATLHRILVNPHFSHPSARLALARAFYQVGIPEIALSLAKPLLDRSLLEWEAAELMDRLQPSWDSFIPKIGQPALGPYR